ncbi:hypothetical protein DFJ77DRAFT_470328 [Powellomyces hirtus]|nr:hypothetical protein DFJ77DRAFT_470328 [Powellomyces hirtus]
MDLPLDLSSPSPPPSSSSSSSDLSEPSSPTHAATTSLPAPSTLSAALRASQKAAETELNDFRTAVVGVAADAFAESLRVAVGETARHYEHWTTAQRLALWPLPYDRAPRPNKYTPLPDDINFLDSDDDTSFAEHISYGPCRPVADDDAALLPEDLPGQTSLAVELDVAANQIWYDEWVRQRGDRDAQLAAADAEPRPQLHKIPLPSERKTMAGLTEHMLQNLLQTFWNIRDSHLKDSGSDRRPAPLDWDSVLNAALVNGVPDNVLQNARHRLERMQAPTSLREGKSKSKSKSIDTRTASNSPSTSPATTRSHTHPPPRTRTPGRGRGSKFAPRGTVFRYKMHAQRDGLDDAAFVFGDGGSGAALGLDLELDSKADVKSILTSGKRKRDRVLSKECGGGGDRGGDSGQEGAGEADDTMETERASKRVRRMEPADGGS